LVHEGERGLQIPQQRSVTLAIDLEIQEGAEDHSTEETDRKHGRDPRGAITSTLGLVPEPTSGAAAVDSRSSYLFHLKPRQAIPAAQVSIQEKFRKLRH
jgi:hypothetical protein